MKKWQIANEQMANGKWQLRICYDWDIIRVGRAGVESAGDTCRGRAPVSSVPLAHPVATGTVHILV